MGPPDEAILAVAIWAAGLEFLLKHRVQLTHGSKTTGSNAPGPRKKGPSYPELVMGTSYADSSKNKRKYYFLSFFSHSTSSHPGFTNFRLKYAQAKMYSPPFLPLSLV